MMLCSFSSVMTTFGYVLVAILILLIMITIHELGHYTAGKIFKFKINEFAIGFGKPLYKRTRKNGEVFSIRLVPLGGYCAFEGEDEDNKAEPRAFNNYAPWKRLIVLFSGAFFNYVFALLIVIFSFTIFGQFKPTVFKVYESAIDNVPAQNILQVDDVILKVNNREIYLATDIDKELSKFQKGEKIVFLISRDGKEQNVEIIKREYNVTLADGTVTKVGMGISMSSDNYRYSFFKSIGNSFVYCFKLSGAILSLFGQLITGALGLNALGGPITTIVQTSEIASMGFNYILEITALIGVNLAVFNLLPVPALDGSRMVFTTIEWIRGKPINRKVEGYIHAVGIVLLFTFVILVDILQLFT